MEREQGRQDLEQRLKEALLAARKKLAAGDVVGAGLELDAAVAACAQAADHGTRIDDPEALLDLVKACTTAAARAEQELHAELHRVNKASVAGKAYAGSASRSRN